MSLIHANETLFTGGVRVAENTASLPFGNGISLSPTYKFMDYPVQADGDYIADSQVVLSAEDAAKVDSFPKTLFLKNTEIPGYARTLSIVLSRVLTGDETLVVDYTGLDYLGRKVVGQLPGIVTNSTVRVYVLQKALKTVTSVKTTVAVAVAGDTALSISVGISNMIAFPFAVRNKSLVSNLMINGTDALALADAANFNKGYPQTAGVFVPAPAVGYSNYIYTIDSNGNKTLVEKERVAAPTATSTDPFGLITFGTLNSTSGNGSARFSFSADLFCEGQSALLQEQLENDYPLYEASLKNIAQTGSLSVSTTNANSVGINALYNGISLLEPSVTTGLQYSGA